jgi:hypothetical protein
MPLRLRHRSDGQGKATPFSIPADGHLEFRRSSQLSPKGSMLVRDQASGYFMDVFLSRFAGADETDGSTPPRGGPHRILPIPRIPVRQYDAIA